LVTDDEVKAEQKFAYLKSRFLALCQEIERPGINDLLKWLEENGFYTAPASSRYHGAYRGGLLEHSLNVYNELVRVLEAYSESFDLDLLNSNGSIIIASLFHDVCKVNMYTTEKRNRKNAEGKWESYDAYKIDEQFAYGGHGSKSVYIIQSFMPLRPEEAVAIQCHMGAWEDGAGKYVGKSYEQFPFAWALHVADEAATFIKEGRREG